MAMSGFTRAGVRAGPPKLFADSQRRADAGRRHRRRDAERPGAVHAGRRDRGAARPRRHVGRGHRHGLVPRRRRRARVRPPDVPGRRDLRAGRGRRDPHRHPVGDERLHRGVAAARARHAGAGPPVDDLGRHRAEDPHDPGRHLHRRRRRARRDKGEFHVEVLDNRFFTAGAGRRSRPTNAISLYLPDRDHVTATHAIQGEDQGLRAARSSSTTSTRRTAPAAWWTARAACARSCRCCMNPFAPVEVERVELKVDLRFDTNFGDIKAMQLPARELVPGKRDLRRGRAAPLRRPRRDRAGARSSCRPAWPGSIVQLEVIGGRRRRGSTPRRRVDLPTWSRRCASSCPATSTP